MAALSKETASNTEDAQKYHATLTNAALISECKQIKDLLPPEDFHHLNDRQCLATIRKTEHRSLRLKIDIVEEYPLSDQSLVIEITSNHLGARLIKYLHKGLSKICDSNKGKPRIFLMIQSLHEIMEHNLLTFAFDEVHKIKKMFKHNPSITLKINETKGKIDIKMVHDEYRSHFILNVPEQYPYDAVTFKVKSCSFPERYQIMYSAQANNLCTKLSKGFDVEYVFGKRELKWKGDLSSIEKADTEFTKNSHLEIRSDLKTMHKMSKFHNELLDERKVRRKVRKMNKEVKEEEEKEKEMRKKMRNMVIDHERQFRDPLPSLVVCIEYLVKEFTELPLTRCALCQKRLFPKKSALVAEWENNPKKYVNKGKYPQRCACGHWFHHECLLKFIETPPFGKECPVADCSAKLKHPKFETDPKVLERRWAAIEAKKREMNDIDDFVSMFD